MIVFTTHLIPRGCSNCKRAIPHGTHVQVDGQHFVLCDACSIELLQALAFKRELHEAAPAPGPDSSNPPKGGVA